MSQILERLPSVSVTVAADAVIALERIGRARPEVILLDLEMPHMDGLTLLRTVMASDDPIPVVVCSGHAGAGSRKALAALELGAVDIVTKPQLGVRGRQDDRSGRGDVRRVRDAARRGTPQSPHSAPAAQASWKV